MTKETDYMRRLKVLNDDSGHVVKITEDHQGRPLPHTLKFNTRLKDELDYLPQWNNEDWDSFGLIIGKPGVGKSILAQKIAAYLDADFNLGNIVFTLKQFRELLAVIEPGSVVIFDEADELADHYATLREVVRQSKRIRTKNLYVLIVTPTLRDITEHFIYRSRFVIYVPMYGPKDRGYFFYYAGEDYIYNLYWGVKDRGERQIVYKDSRSVIMNGYHGKQDMTGWFIDKRAYEKRKEDARKDAEEEKPLTTNKQRIAGIKGVLAVQRNLANINEKDPSQREIARNGGWSAMYVSKALREAEKLREEGLIT